MYTVKTVADASVRSSNTDIGGLATIDKREAALMVWNYHDDDLQDAGKAVEIDMNDLPAKTVTVTQYRIDQQYSNSYEAWKKMGSPQKPTAEQIAELEKAGQLQMTAKPEKRLVKSGRLHTQITLPRQGVSLLKVSW
jgi:xylan 1,4-beta-xylosidase